MPEGLSAHIQYEKDAGIDLFSIKDAISKYEVFTTLSSRNKQYPSVLAFAGARYSRSSLSIEEIFLEIKNGKKSAQSRLADIFNNYGHASVGDMAMLFAYMQHISFLTAFFFFYNSSIGAGQERSSRYQNYRESRLPELRTFTKTYPSKTLLRKYQELEDFALDAYDTYREILTNAYTAYYCPAEGSKSQMSALNSRVNDSIRYFLLSGFSTSFAYITSAREWAHMIGELTSRQSPKLHRLGVDLLNLFVPPGSVIQEMGFIPEAPDLIRHTEGTVQIQENLRKVSAIIEEKTDIFRNVKKVSARGMYVRQDVSLIDASYSPAEIMLCEYILSLSPTRDIPSLLRAVAHIPLAVKKELSAALFAGHDNYIQMNSMARQNAYSYVLHMSIAEARDLNRHRAFARFTPLCEYPDNCEEYLDFGFGIPLYLETIPEFAAIKKTFIADLSMYYMKLDDFISQLQSDAIAYDEQLILSLLPLGSNIPYFMHGSVKEISYMTNQRSRPGGHINYRALAYDMAADAAARDPLLTGMALGEKPDPSNKMEFFDRS